MLMLLMKIEFLWLFLIPEDCAGYPGVGTGHDEVRKDGAAARNGAKTASSVYGDAHKSCKGEL